MRKLFWVAAVLVCIATPAASQTDIPNLVGTWKGTSESVVIGSNPHHPGAPGNEPRFTSVAFTLKIEKQEGRRFYGTFSSERANEKVIAVISQDGTIIMVDDDGYDTGTILAPDRIEICYQHLSANSRIASCTEFTKQP